jgi:xanthine dehydrogenase small subunit
METSDTITFLLNGKVHNVQIASDTPFKPGITVLNYLRMLPGHKGVKEGCAEGDCGACTVVLAESDENGSLQYRAVDSCLLFLPMIHGKQLITVENLEDPSAGENNLHPVQKALVAHNGSQCGYCTPGFAMSMFALYKNHNHPTREAVLDALTGNLCRCTGYRPIVDAALHSCSNKGQDHLTSAEKEVMQLLQQISGNRISLKLQSGGQTWYAPATLAEAIELYGQNPQALIVAGATDAALRQTKKFEHLPLVIDLSGVRELSVWRETEDFLHLGSGLNLEKVRQIVKDKIPPFYDLLNVFGSLQIRNMATLGGNIASASPVADIPPLLFVLDAAIQVEGSSGKRTIPIEKFITGYRKTSLQPGELIISVVIPLIRRGEYVKFYKISRRKDLDISTVSAAFALRLNNSFVESIRMAYGGMAAQTRRASEAEQFLMGKEWNISNIAHAMKLTEEAFTPISDARAEKEVRTIAASNLLLKFFNDTCQSETPVPSF